MRLSFTVVFASLVGVAPPQVTQPDFRLQVVPAIVYSVNDPGGARTSSFVFTLAVIWTATLLVPSQTAAHCCRRRSDSSLM